MSRRLEHPNRGCPLRRLSLGALLFVFAGCATAPPPQERTTSYEVNGRRYYPLSSSSGFVQQGLASWYGRKFHGRATSNGEPFNMYEYTAAHKTLPFNTYVRVINLKNARATLVRINDRGPFVRGRIIDLTYAAACALGMVQDGVAPVRIEALGYMNRKRRSGKLIQEFVTPPSYQRGDFTVQVGAFAQQENALRLRASLSQKYRHASLTVTQRGGQLLYRVQVGQYSRLDNARAAARQLQEQGFPNAFVVAGAN